MTYESLFYQSSFQWDVYGVVFFSCPQSNMTWWIGNLKGKNKYSGFFSLSSCASASDKQYMYKVAVLFCVLIKEIPKIFREKLQNTSRHHPDRDPSSFSSMCKTPACWKEVFAPIMWPGKKFSNY